jgi:hypothetical protein
VLAAGGSYAAGGLPGISVATAATHSGYVSGVTRLVAGRLGTDV